MFHIFSKKRNSVGIDIENNYIRFVNLLSNKSFDKVVSFGEVYFTVSPFGESVINDEDKLIEFLTKIKKDTGSQKFFVTLPSIHFKYLSFSFGQEMDKKDLETYLRMKNLITYDEEIFYYEKKFLNKNNQKYNIFISSKILCKQYKNVFDKSGIKNVSFVSRDRAILNSCVPKNSDSSFFIVLVEKDISYFLLKSNDKEDIFIESISDRKNITFLINKIYIDWYQKKHKKIDHCFIAGSMSNDFDFVDYVFSSTKINFIKPNIFINRKIDDRNIPIIKKEDSFKFALALGAIDL